MSRVATLASSSGLGSAVDVRGLSYAFAGASEPAIDWIDLHVGPGEFVCLLGPSGCGKTTLLRIVAGLLTARTGQVVLEAEAEAAVGWMAQRDGLLPWQTVLANVQLPLKLQHRSSVDAREAARQMLARVGLSNVAGRYPHQLSGGMRQRVALARALVHQPALLLLDEPFAHLDELTRGELGDELVRLWVQSRPTVIMVTHSALEAARLADRVVVLSPGPARVVGEVDMATAQPRDEADSGVLGAVARAKELMRGGA